MLNIPPEVLNEICGYLPPCFDPKGAWRARRTIQESYNTILNVAMSSRSLNAAVTPALYDTIVCFGHDFRRLFGLLGSLSRHPYNAKRVKRVYMLPLGRDLTREPSKESTRTRHRKRDFFNLNVATLISSCESLEEAYLRTRCQVFPGDQYGWALGLVPRTMANLRRLAASTISSRPGATHATNHIGRPSPSSWLAALVRRAGYMRLQGHLSFHTERLFPLSKENSARCITNLRWKGAANTGKDLERILQACPFLRNITILLYDRQSIIDWVDIGVALHEGGHLLEDFSIQYTWDSLGGFPDWDGLIGDISSMTSLTRFRAPLEALIEEDDHLHDKMPQSLSSLTIETAACEIPEYFDMWLLTFVEQRQGSHLKSIDVLDMGNRPDLLNALARLGWEFHGTEEGEFEMVYKLRKIDFDAERLTILD